MILAKASPLRSGRSRAKVFPNDIPTHSSAPLMRTLLLFAGFSLVFALAACDSTGIDDDGGEGCQSYHCGDGDGDGGGNGTNATIDINPRQTYLRTSQDNAVDAPAISLSDLGYTTGDSICFSVVGDFSLVEGFLASERDEGFLTAVFSGSDRLRADTNLMRVSDAIEAGDDVFTLDTDKNALHTDIDQDFSADDACLVIPEGAKYVFFAAYDSFYSDNANIDGTPFQVQIKK